MIELRGQNIEVIFRCKCGAYTTKTKGIGLCVQRDCESGLGLRFGARHMEMPEGWNGADPANLLCPDCDNEGKDENDQDEMIKADYRERARDLNNENKRKT